jgi:N-acetylglutamate synthase-like GNAT family acetyltransferase
MIRGRYLTSADDIGAVLDVRRRVALCEGLPATGADEHDEMAVYALVFDEDDRPAGSGRLYLDGDRFMIGSIGVLPEVRGRGLGDLIMRMLLFRAQELNAPSVYARAVPGLEGFYALYGFSPADDEGDKALLMVPADRIPGGSCGGHMM